MSRTYSGMEGWEYDAQDDGLVFMLGGREGQPGWIKESVLESAGRKMRCQAKKWADRKRKRHAEYLKWG